MKASKELLTTLQDISRRISTVSADPERYELDSDALADLNLARDSVDKLIKRVERLVE